MVFGAIALLIIVADQFSKTWIRTNLTPGESLFDKGFFRIIHIQNTGAAFGLFQDHTQTIIIVAFVGIIVILLLLFLLRSRWSFMDSMLVRSGIGLVVGGTIGNQIDRVRLGHVTDFIDFKVWPAFNVADASANVGIAIIVIYLIFLYRPLKHQE